MKIAFVGASGYGNVGDNTYPLVFKQQLPEHELIIYNSDLPSELPSDVKLVVLGGGGILYNSRMEREADESPHFRCMKFYMDWAIAHHLPFGILTCGFQFAPGQSPSNSAALTPWVPYLKQALFLTLRSPTCVQVAADLTGRSDCHFFPDAAYLLRPTNPPAPSHRRSLVIVPTGQVHPGDSLVQHFTRLFHRDHFDHFWMSMGAMVDDAVILKDTRRIYPKATIIESPTPSEALEKIASAHFVITGRFHGLIFARGAGVPFYVPQDSPYKIKSEDFSADPARAAGHFEVLRTALASL
jgi:hypothetical protein